MSSPYLGDSVFWIEIDKIDPNPYQPRREFEEARLNDLAESIRQYGILQPLVVSRTEVIKEDGGLTTRYELVAGERRLRASKIAGLREVPALIRASADDARLKLELAIIENLQREDLNAVDRAKAFDRLVKEFGFKHTQIATKVGKSREYVSNTLRLLALPEEILQALSEGKISEGHTRPLLMVAGKEGEQMTLFKEIIYKKLSVRDAEALSRRIATEKVRKKELIDPEMIEIEKRLTESLGTRVHVEKKENGGKVVIDFFTLEDLESIIGHIKTEGVRKNSTEMMQKFIDGQKPISIDGVPAVASILAPNTSSIDPEIGTPEEVAENVLAEEVEEVAVDDRSKEEVKEAEEAEDLYSVKNFSL